MLAQGSEMLNFAAMSSICQSPSEEWFPNMKTELTNVTFILSTVTGSLE